MKNINKTISVIVPVYNEIAIIKQFHEQLFTTLTSYKNPFEIIYIDDNSTDGTFEWLQTAAIPSLVYAIRKDGIKGKAYSLIQGFDQAQGNVFVMIDGDLQYPPDKIPALVDALENADVSVGTREDYKESKMRKFLSRSFKKVFGTMLFGLSTDIQSGFKAFTREVYEAVKFEPNSPWTFDLEFLNKAKDAGFAITNVPITFAPRLNGESKVNVMKQSYEIGSNALAVKLKRNKKYTIIKPTAGSMKGAGVGHKSKKYITHTTLPSKLSAIQTFSLGQKVFFIGFPLLLLLLLFIFPLKTARIIVGVLSILYFVDALFNIFVVTRSLNKDEEIRVSDNELALLDESILPTYSILCPLYKEAHVVPQFLEGISKIDWPKEKLDVMFLLEEDDVETIEAFGRMTLPFYARTVIVPDSQPKTKPKACNYGLAFAKGEYLVIFDAEDVPDPLQLKKAFIGFQKAPANVTCLQAKLSYYNSRQNLLTRFFTAEYALWFDVMLPGLQSLNSALPLGGTSNHFQTENLRQLQGWDPFNVTEDADLGVRLFQKGYRTAIIDSTTYEEATSVNKNWLRQRSRWIKGYMQTYLVHMRNIRSFVKEKGLIHQAIFQLTVGGKILFVLLNPFMWIITALYFFAYPVIGPLMQSIYQAPISYIAVFSWIFGNFMFLYCYMLAVAKRKQWDLAKYVLIIPLYWAMMSTSAMIALYQLILKPHYWEKTLHGFHLAGRKEEAKLAQTVVQPAPAYAAIADDPIATPIAVPAAIPDFKQVRPSMRLPAFAFPSREKAISGLGIILPFIALLNIDLVLARIFLPLPDAQLYLVISFFGKAVFLASQLASNGVTRLISRNSSVKNRYFKLLFTTFIFNWAAYVAFGLEGAYVLPLLFGNASQAIIPYTSFYLFALLCFGLAERIAAYHLTKKHLSYVLISFFILFLQVPLLVVRHETIADFAKTFAYIGSINLLVMIILHLSKPYTQIMENNFASLLGLFFHTNSKKIIEDNRMRVLIFNWRDTKHVYAGGAEVYIHELSKRWIQNGNKVTLFCGNDNTNATYEVVDGVEVYRRGGTYTVYMFAMIYYLFKFRGNYDVIVDCENGIPFFMPLIAKEQVVLLIHHVHQEIFRKFLQFPMRNIAALLEGKMMPFIYQNKHVVTVSPSSQKEIFQLGFTKAGNIDIIPNGVSEALFVSYPKTDHPSYIYLGRLKEYKNIDIAIIAFSKVLKVHKNATLSIVGDGEYYPELNALVAELGVKKAVTFHGRVSEEEKALLLSQSWAALQPSQMEGWGITVIEANATGTPVIASQVNGLQDSVVDRQTGLLVPAGDVASFAIAMKKIADDDMLRMNLSQEATVWARNFNWNKSADEFYSLIGRSFGQSFVRPIYSDITYAASNKRAK